MSNSELPGPSGLGSVAKFSSPKKKRAKKTAMSSLEKTVLINIYKLVEETWPKNEFIYRKDIAKKTAETAGVSLSTVYNVLAEYKNEKRVHSPIPAPKRVTKIDLLDELDLSGIRRKFHEFFFRNEPPSLSQVLQAVNDDETLPNFKRTTFQKLIKKLDIKYLKRSRKSMLIEKSDIVRWRFDYLTKIIKFREEKRKIYYLDETWLNEGHTKSKVWQDVSVQSSREAHREGLSTGLKAPTGKGRRLIILHIGSDDGFLNGGELIFESKKGEGDYHQEMNSKIFEDWFMKIINKIEPNSIFVMDNAPYHSRRLERVPTMVWLKTDIQKWLNEKGIPFETNIGQWAVVFSKQLLRFLAVLLNGIHIMNVWWLYYFYIMKNTESKMLIRVFFWIPCFFYIKVQSPVLVVELTLNRLEGTQLRALGLLSVFGFNMTYVVKAPTDAPGPTSCSAIECRLLGHCYAKHDYKEFYCACFEGYSGADCGVGPLCPRTSNMCKNGGTCRQMGPAAVSCICAPGYTGDLCESQIAAPECGIEECSEGCRKRSSCDCNPKDTDVSSARFETRLQIMDQGDVNISEEIVKQITNYLRASNITLHDDIEILNISSPETSGARTVWLRVWGARREAGALRTALARLAATRSRTDRLRLLPATLHFDMQPALSLHALIVNQRPEVWEGSEFILSCMAYGSPEIAFTWYKDGIKVNFNGTTRDIWTRTVAEDALGRRMSVLGISEARKSDSGRWSCSADDAGRRRCSALRLTILRPPDIRLVPSTLTVNKGDNVSITCLAGAGRVHGALGFSWARERSLLPLAPGREVWEDLYPAGSVLKLYNVQKSCEFRCQVSSVAGTNAKGVTMWALGVKDEACETEASHGLRWPKTAPGAHASAACPPGHTGESTRFCEPKTTQHGVKWNLPDFSGCVADSLKDIHEQFTRISYGYSWDNVSNVAHQYGAVLRSLPAHPGEGTLPLQHAREMLQYLQSSAGKPKDKQDSVEHLLIIYDTLLKHPDAFLDEEKIYELQNGVVDTAAMRDNLDLHYQEFAVKTKQVREDSAAHFSFTPNPSTDEWLLTSTGVELVARTGNASVIAVQYHNIAARLPSLRRSIEFNASYSRSGREMEYRLASAQVQLAASHVDVTLHHTVTLLFVHSKNYTAIASKLACGLRTPSEPSAWVIKACEVRIPEPTHVACRCRGLGTYGLFTIARSTLTDVEKDLRGVVKITVGLGGAMCLAAAALQLLSLVPGRKARLPVLLKAATAGTHSAAVLTLLECDTRQEEACPGALGWVCAACWCAGCAALCAQPLLLQAELAGRAQRVPSVALLAGVCTLAWLTARLWGGAPLQLGAAAQAVCAAGCALLAVLCFALAVCAALRLRTITHKVPAERRTYLRDRARVVRHTLAVLGSTSAAQAAGVWWAQPGPRSLAHVLVLSVAALANGITMLICYVIRDEECLQSAKKVLSLPSHRDWQESPAGDTSLSLYIKQGGEVESRGGAGLVESNSSPVSPLTSYWRAPGLESPARLHRRQSTPDSRADIVRCVEYKDSLLSPHRYEAHHVTTTHAVCDLIPRNPHSPLSLVTPAPHSPIHLVPHNNHSPIHFVPHNPRSPLNPQPEYRARLCLELGVLKTPPTETNAPLLTCSVDFEPYDKTFDTSKEACTICVQSNPDVSKVTSPPIKSCLKKSKKDFTSSISLPSMELKEDNKSKSDIEQVNREWNKAYDSPETDRMLNKISDDLDFLLNRTQEKKTILDQIEEAPT